MEIGSEFSNGDIHLKKISQFDIPMGDDNLFLMSGRTCIDFILKNILHEKKITKAYLPNYCCQSMIDPFKTNNIECAFYNIIYKNHRLIADIDLNVEAEVLLCVGNYFGFNDTIYDKSILTILKKKGTIIIEDCTHSIFTSKPMETSDYFFASLRKWLPIYCGAICSKKNGEFILYKNLSLIDFNALHVKKKAMEEKEKYLNKKNNINKKNFLNKFSSFNNYINKNYELMLIDNDSLHKILFFDYELFKKRRMENANFLITEISKIDKTLLVYDKLEDGDIPLFVPIIVANRDFLKNEFIKNEIYCPSHWPKPSIVSSNNLYEKELSLVCDQRYSITDMKKIIKCIKKWWEKYGKQ